ncbi:MAG: hypothetical protein KIT18_15065 [Burkholderiales bacterium]|nr:hypothetical protein [Burkholderiales bacterium]
MPIPWQHVVVGKAYRTASGETWRVTAISANGDVIFHAADDVPSSRLSSEEFAAAVVEIIEPGAE